KAPPIPVGQPGTETRIPLRGLRKKIAEHMALSKRTAAHFTYVEEVEVTDLVKFRASAKESAAQRGVKLTYLPFILKAIVAGLRDFPMLNSSLDEERGEIVVRNSYNFGIAVDTEDGLVVPVVKAVDQRSILDLAREIDRLATAAREGKLALDDLRGGTFTITNAGNIGGLFATPVINFPEVAILGIHKIAKRPIVKNDQIVIGDVMLLSISIDHRVVDGADGARFMNRVVALLQDPRLLLLE
ncbi:MAG: 2-oxo acid dehydrogenase subunit E2, partial [Planctomycetes bacterium]|nr:2-oxo acid dehydrogenase subunit E2 [Planctomycetota bacterium]